MSEHEIGQDVPAFGITVAAQLAGLHPQTLRQYDRLGLVSPDRTVGRNRLYSANDILRLREVARLSAAGVTLAGIIRIMELEHQLEAAVREITALREQIGPSTALVVWRPARRQL
ncbi:MAG: MerR family transcriptional regulator [Actinobacteria bacterium]|nr:MerR family transcriptional regulator [Actinomycetota bacterium]NBY15463.1 MerR family transcriptional regulator [Actinomycetota bacterium]